MTPVSRSIRFGGRHVFICGESLILDDIAAVRSPTKVVCTRRRGASFEFGPVGSLWIDALTHRATASASAVFEIECLSSCTGKMSMSSRPKRLRVSSIRPDARMRRFPSAGSISTTMSMSLPAGAVPRATDPKSRGLLAAYFAKTAPNSSRRSSRRARKATEFGVSVGAGMPPRYRGVRRDATDYASSQQWGRAVSLHGGARSGVERGPQRRVPASCVAVAGPARSLQLSTFGQRNVVHTTLLPPSPEMRVDGQRSPFGLVSNVARTVGNTERRAGYVVGGV